MYNFTFIWTYFTLLLPLYAFMAWTGLSSSFTFSPIIIHITLLSRHPWFILTLLLMHRSVTQKAPLNHAMQTSLTPSSHQKWSTEERWIIPNLKYAGIANLKFSALKKKGKGRLWVLQHCCLEAYCTLTWMSSFIHLQRRCTHQAAWETSAREGRNYTWNLASNP